LNNYSGLSDSRRLFGEVGETKKKGYVTGDEEYVLGGNQHTHLNGHTSPNYNLGGWLYLKSDGL